MKIPWREFMNTDAELHAFVIGICEVLCPWPPRCHCEPFASCHSEGAKRPKNLAQGKLREAIPKEYHYYLFGRAMGVIAWLIIAKIIQEVFW